MRKGELAIKTIIILVIMILLLGIVMYFMLSQSKIVSNKADANKIFSTKCQEYQSDYSCSWSATREPDFDKFLQACKYLYGEERESFSCLMSLCCKEVKFDDVQCEGLCRLCRGNYLTGIKTDKCCEQFAAKCSIKCDVC